MILVVDASIACKWLVEERDSADAVKVLELGEELIAPDIIITEVCSVLWQKRRRGQISGEHARSALDSLPEFFDQLLPSRSLAQKALDIAVTFNHPVNDCLYLAAAETYDASLVTADRRLLESAAGSGRAGLAIGTDNLRSRR